MSVSAADLRARSRLAHALVPLLLLLRLGPLHAQSFSYTRDCNDQQNRELHCVVRPVDCEDDAQFPQVNRSAALPDPAHDIRVSAVAKAVSKLKGESYQLSVDVSWQTPPNNSTALLYGFLLEVNSADGKQHHCFLFDVKGTNWTESTINMSPRLHFFTESLFRFSMGYDISVHSLPESAELTQSAHKKVTMPINPRSMSQSNLLPSNCSHSSHPFASQWAAGFRRVVVYPLTRTVNVEFIAAPPEYCFEQYEVRLMDETVMLVERSGLIYIDQLTEEITNGTVHYIGHFNFTDVEVNKTYTPTVIPVETSTGGRCLCPVHSHHRPQSKNVVCTCVNSESKKIKLIKMDAAKTICMGCTNDTNAILDKPTERVADQSWTYHLLLSLLVLLVLFFLTVLMVFLYRWYKRWGKSFRVQLIHDRNRSPSPNLNHHHSAQTRLLLKPSLVKSANLNVLIVYSHDSPEHDEAVMALAEYLKDVFNIEVHMDVYDKDQIERNLMDYLSSSIVSADFVLVVNSFGAAQRYLTKVQGNGNPEIQVVCRNESIPLDQLFAQQIDMALQHGNLLSIRFNYSQFNQVLPALQDRLQYVMPENLTPLASAVHGRSLKEDPRVLGFSSQLARLRRAVDAAQRALAADADWFSKSHHRRAVRPPPLAALPPLMLLEPAAPPQQGQPEPLAESGVSCSSPSSTNSTPDVAAPARWSPQPADQDQPQPQPQPLTQLDDARNWAQSAQPDWAQPPQHVPKWRTDPNGDSGLVADADLDLISAS